MLGLGRFGWLCAVVNEETDCKGTSWYGSDSGAAGLAGDGAVARVSRNSRATWASMNRLTRSETFSNNGVCSGFGSSGAIEFSGDPWCLALRLTPEVWIAVVKGVEYGGC